MSNNLQGLTSYDIQPGPFSEDELREQWNAQADVDELNHWDNLGLDEQLAWAQTRAIAADRAQGAPRDMPPAVDVTEQATTIRYEFEIFDEHDQTVASGDAPTLEDAEREGRHYLAQYHQEGPHTLEVRRVEIFMVAQTRAIAADRAQGAPCDQPPPVAAADRPRYLQETPDGWQGADHPDGP